MQHHTWLTNHIFYHHNSSDVGSLLVHGAMLGMMETKEDRTLIGREVAA